MVRLLLIVAFAVGTFVIALPSTSEAQDLSVAEQQYVGRSLTLFAMTVASFERVNDLTADPRMLESDWQNDFIGETSVWKAIYQESMEIHVPVRFKEANDKAITAYEYLYEAAGEMRLAVEMTDPVVIAGVADTLSPVSDAIEEAVRLLAEAV